MPDSGYPHKLLVHINKLKVDTNEILAPTSRVSHQVLAMCAGNALSYGAGNSLPETFISRESIGVESRAEDFASGDMADVEIELDIGDRQNGRDLAEVERILRKDFATFNVIPRHILESGGLRVRFKFKT